MIEYKVAKEAENYIKVRTEVAERAELLYELIKDEGENTLRTRFIDAMVENQKLKEDNAKLRDNLRKAYDFMEKVVLDGRNMLEKFKETFRDVPTRVRDKFIR